MSTTQETPTSVLTDREQQAIKNINAVLDGDGSDPDSGPGAWGDCGEVDVPVLLDAVLRLSKLVATQAPASDEVLDEMETLLGQLSPKPLLALDPQPETGEVIILEETRRNVVTWLCTMAEQSGNKEGWAKLLVSAVNAAPALVARVRLAEARAYPETLNPELNEVLGWPNFWCAGYANAFRAAGYDIPRKAEREQAFVLHWLTGLVLKHGAGWRAAAISEFEALREKVVGKGEPTNE